MIKVYPAVIHDEGTFWVEFPDLEGCQSCGASLEEVIELAQEALGLYLANLYERHLELPEPSRLETIKTEDGQATYIFADVDKYRNDTKAVKKMISIPAWLAKEAEANSISLSKVLQDALKSKLNLA